MRTVAVVQARMGSNRLPGKVMTDIAGKPMLERVLRRLSGAYLPDDIAVATTTLSDDDVIASYCEQHGRPCFRGSETDVLDRYYRAAGELGAEVIVRITSDCPLIDPEIVDRVVALVTDAHPGADYASNVLPYRTFPRGLDVEAFTFEMLQRAWRLDRDPASREHVTPFIHRTSSLFRIATVSADADYSDLRWTVDEPEDLALVREIFAQFGRDRFSWKEVINCYDDHPEWREINCNVSQKAV